MARRRDGGFVMSCAGFALSLSALAPAAVAVLGGALTAPPARAQAETVEPYWVVVTTPDSNLRCGAGSVWYPVGKAASGQLLRVDGRENEWLRVGYPKGLPVLVKATEVSVDDSKGLVRTTTPTQLLANNPVGGLFQSWRVLLDVQLPVGTELPLIADVRDTTGEISAYRVGAPDMARAWISERFVRPATPEEVAVWTGTARPVAEADAQPTTTPEVAQTSDAAPAATPQEQAAAPEPTQPTQQAADAGVDAAPEGDSQVVSSEMASSDGRAAGMPPSSPDPAPAAADAAADTQQANAGGGAGGRSVATLEQLKSAFDGLKRVSTEDAEIEPLIAEYERFIASLDDTPGNSARRAYARSQIELLRVRLDLQKQLHQIRRTEEFADSSANTVAEAVRMMAANPRYIVVGRLGASTVYDGVNLPRMYRVQSVEGGVGRTLAYVLPAEGVDVIGFIGQIVGVVGAADADQGLGLPVIVPTRLDALTRMTP